MKKAAVLGAVTLVFATARADANPMDMYGLGSRSIGMGNGVSADVQDFSANYYNPAGLVRSGAFQLAAGYGYVSHSLTTNGEDNHVDPARALVTGIVAPGRLFHVPFAFGLALSLPDERLASARLLPQTQPRWELYDNRVQELYFAANLAVEILHGVRIGGGFAYIASAVGSIGLTGQIPTSGAAQLAHTVDADVVAVWYPQAGLQVDVLPNLTLSAVYRGEYRFRVDLDADLNLQIVVGQLTNPNAVRVNGLIALEERAVAAFLPQQGVLGAAWRPIPSLTVVADVTWVNWSAYVNPAADIAVQVHFDMPPGSEMVPRPNIPPPMHPEPANFHDTIVPRIGLEWRHDVLGQQLALRGGYRYDPSPVPDQTGITNFLDCTRHVFALGAGVRFRNTGPTPQSSVSIDVHGDLQVLETRSVMKSDPADAVGDYVLGGHVLNVGVTLATTF